MWQILALTSALFSALAAGFEKKILFVSKPLDFSLLLSFITLLLTLPFLYVADLTLLETTTLIVLYGKSILGAVSFLLVMHGIKNLELSSALPLLVLTPGVVAIFAYFILGESLSTRDIIGMTLLLLGTYFLQLKKGSSLIEPLLFVKQNMAYLYIIGAILLFTTTSLLDKTLLKTYKLQPEAFLPIQQMFFTFNFLILFVIKRQKITALKLTFHHSWKLIIAVAIFTVIYRYSHILAIKAGSVALVLSIKRTSVFFATVFGGQYFKESNLTIKSIATVIMIAGAILIVLS